MKNLLDSNGLAIEAGVITVYHYNAESGEFSQQSDELLAAGVGIPAHSCIDAPPETSTDFVARRNADGWEIVVDHRGTVIYSTETGEKITVTELGELPANSTTLAPSSAFDRWNGKKWATDASAQQAAAVAEAQSQRAVLIAQANTAIIPLQDAADLDMATDEETQQLAAWKKYRVLLNRIDVNSAPVIRWPTQPEMR